MRKNPRLGTNLVNKQVSERLMKVNVAVGVLLSAVMFVIALPLGPLPGLASVCFVPLFIFIRRTMLKTPWWLLQFKPS